MRWLEKRNPQMMSRCQLRANGKKAENAEFEVMFRPKDSLKNGPMVLGFCSLDCKSSVAIDCSDCDGRNEGAIRGLNAATLSAS